MKTSYSIQSELSAESFPEPSENADEILARLEGRCNDLILALLLARERLDFMEQAQLKRLQALQGLHGGLN